MRLWQQLNSIARHPATLLAIRVLVGGVFIAFAIAKAFEPREDFYNVIATYQLLPAAVIPVFANALILIELLVGIAFVLGLYLRWSGYALLLLLSMFMVAIAQTMLRGIPLADCGCSGSFINIGDSAPQVLLRDGAMLIGVLWVLHTRSAAATLDRLFEPRIRSTPKN